MIYVVMNMVISLAVALPAAYAFSRYSFLGDKHLFFWRGQPDGSTCGLCPAPFFFSRLCKLRLVCLRMCRRLAHALFNVPLAVWILEGFMRGVPKLTAYIDGYSFRGFRSDIHAACCL
jgi:glycerol transport system permease protein